KLRCPHVLAVPGASGRRPWPDAGNVSTGAGARAGAVRAQRAGSGTAAAVRGPLRGGDAVVRGLQGTVGAGAGRLAPGAAGGSGHRCARPRGTRLDAAATAAVGSGAAATAAATAQGPPTPGHSRSPARRQSEASTDSSMPAPAAGVAAAAGVSSPALAAMERFEAGVAALSARQADVIDRALELVHHAVRQSPRLAVRVVYPRQSLVRLCAAFFPGAVALMAELVDAVNTVCAPPEPWLSPGFE
ncbi:unnamed protein product, partial [Phaeothamnion confervicola]